MNEHRRLRRACPLDAEALAGLYAELDRSGRRPDPQRAAAWIATCRERPDRTLLVIEVQGAVVASALLVVIDNLAHGGAGIAVLDNLVVSARYRGHGIGSELLAHCAQRATDAGCYKLMLSSNLEREAAQAFYRSRGFQLHGYSLALELAAPVAES